MKTASKRIHTRIASLCLLCLLGCSLNILSAQGQPQAQLDTEDPALSKPKEAPTTKTPEEALPETILPTEDLPAAPLLKPDPHQVYLQTIHPLSTTLFRLKHRFEQAKERGQTLSLQIISASSQTAQDQLIRLEQQYQADSPPYESFYQLQQAVRILRDVVSNWQQAKQYNALYRPSARDAESDTQLFTEKMDAAMRAIQTVEQLMQTHHALKSTDLK